MDVMHGLILHRRCILLRCTLPSHVGPPVCPLPLATAEAHSPDAGLRAIGRSVGAGGLPVSLPAQQDGESCLNLPVCVKTMGGHHTDANPQGGQLVPVLLRADGNSAAFAPLPLQARHRPCRSAGPMTSVSQCPPDQRHVSWMRLSPRVYSARMAAHAAQSSNYCSALIPPHRPVSARCLPPRLMRLVAAQDVSFLDVCWDVACAGTGAGTVVLWNLSTVMLPHNCARFAAMMMFAKLDFDFCRPTMLRCVPAPAAHVLVAASDTPSFPARAGALTCGAA